ncbi:dnaJ protein homolog [Lolium rigidum]|uniref:dnaJ protein homolog n=1 Tax=Lolium rigidum TaxID=89674 RepID=UPI001F5C1745|nr:dnaJ protein homolog [Lolium rigidum]XP_047088792.1 dnaJ protein homolog [Lolium rigidum]
MPGNLPVAISDEGMPMYQRPFMNAKLYIHFMVDFPDSLIPDQCKALETVLLPKPVLQHTEELDKRKKKMAFNIEERRGCDSNSGLRRWGHAWL